MHTNVGTNSALQNFTEAAPKILPKAVHRANADRAGTRIDGTIVTALALFFAIVASGVMLAWSKHEARQLFQELERLSSAHDEQQIEWGRLQLEQATWSENSRIEQIARERLGLDFPEQTKVVVIKQ
jgi:cell division protein FtsL